MIFLNYNTFYNTNYYNTFNYLLNIGVFLVVQKATQGHVLQFHGKFSGIIYFFKEPIKNFEIQNLKTHF